MELNFTKMQGAGNDYLYLDCRRTGLPPDAAALAEVEALCFPAAEAAPEQQFRDRLQLMPDTLADV